MSNALRGMIAGFVATLVLGALLLLNSSFELWPELNIIRLLSTLENASFKLGMLVALAMCWPTGGVSMDRDRHRISRQSVGAVE